MIITQPWKYPQPKVTAPAITIGQEWGRLVIDNIQKLDNNNVKASLNGISDHALEGLYVVSMSLMLFPRYVLDDIVLLETNNNLQK